MDKKDIFPSIQKSITDLLNDEEGSIPRNKLVMLGTTIMLMSLMMSIDVMASHSSHRSHSSHSSHVSGGGGDHYSHYSHVSHSSHVSGNGHSSGGSSHSSGGGSHSSGGSSHSSHSNSTPSAGSIPVPQVPKSDSFMKNIPARSAAAVSTLKPESPKFE